MTVFGLLPDSLGSNENCPSSSPTLIAGFAGALRRSEPAAVRVEHLEARLRGLRPALPRTKGERAGKVVAVAIPYGATALRPVRALRRWQAVAGLNEGALFRRI